MKPAAANRKLLFVFIFYWAINALFVYLYSEFVFTDTYYFNALIFRYDAEAIKSIIKMERRGVIIGYLFIPLVSVVRVFVVASCLYGFNIITNKTTKFRDHVEVALTAESIYVIQVIIKFIYVLICGNQLANVQTMTVLLSVNQLFSLEKIPAYLFYLFSFLSVFDVLYIFILAVAYAQRFNQKIQTGLSIVAKSYLPLLIIWIGIVTLLLL